MGTYSGTNFIFGISFVSVIIIELFGTIAVYIVYTIAMRKTGEPLGRY